MTSKTLLLAALALLAARPAPAIPIAIDDPNERINRGSIGYVDIQRVFKLYPEKLKAQDNFEELVRQAEEQINIRKVELLHLRSDLSQLKQERDYVAKTLPVVSVTTTTTGAAVLPVSTGPAVLTAPPAFSTHTVAPHAFVAPTPAPAPTPAVVVSTQSPAPTPTTPPKPAISQLPGLSLPPAPASTATATAPPTAPTPGQPRTFQTVQSQPPAPKSEPLVINIPGISTAPLVAPLAQPEPPPKPQPVVVTSTIAVVNPVLAELDAKIALKERDLARKETDFKEYQTAQEKNLLDLESRKTDILLGKISRAIQEVAHQEGIGIVIDKSTILTGNEAVDLTDKVLKHLQGS